MSENTAPGPDRLQYNHLRSFDTDAKVLTLIYNICLKARKVPSEWKKSTTIFIPKKGAENWRPIALSSTMYKLYTSLIAKRLTSWMEKNDILAPGQKGFRPFDGALENNYVLDRLIARTKRVKADLFAILMDLKNAFRSIPHSAIFHAFRAAGVGDMFGQILEDLYDGNLTSLLTSLGESELFLILLGVKQGCPLSGPIFNLVFNPIFKIIQNGRDELHGLGYADDTAAFEKNP